MSKHKRCKNCIHGKKLVEKKVNGRWKMVEITCPKCHGTGYEEKRKNLFDIILGK